MALNQAGANAKWLETRNWRPKTAAVDALIQEISKAVDGLNNPILVLTLLDNAYFQTGQSDGSIIPNSRDISGIYHVDGDLICGPAETAKKLFTQVIPALKKYQDLDKILLIPLPRYLWSACCNDEEHEANTRCDGYQEEQLADLDACQRLWRGLAHRQGIPNLKICNAGRIVAASELWTDDPVHPSKEGYERVVRFIIQGVADMEAKRKMAATQRMPIRRRNPGPRTRWTGCHPPGSDQRAGPSTTEGNSMAADSAVEVVAGPSSSSALLPFCSSVSYIPLIYLT
jgi:lysophospholipase L1-like esterase